DRARKASTNSISSGASRRVAFTRPMRSDIHVGHVGKRLHGRPKLERAPSYFVTAITAVGASLCDRWVRCEWSHRNPREIAMSNKVTPIVVALAAVSLSVL